jgi:hypothetical protein
MRTSSKDYKNEFYAHSAISSLSQINDPQIKQRLSNISILPDNQLFKTWGVNENWEISENQINNDFWNRNCDSEFKILNEIANILNTNYNIKGNVQLYTELYCCPSCFRVIKQFAEQYPNIDITI